MRWQMALYKEMAGKAEDADAPEKVVKRVQEVSAVLYHLEVVSGFIQALSAKLLPHDLTVEPNPAVSLLGKDGAPVQIQEDGVAQAAVQAEAQSRGGLLPHDAAVQHTEARRLSGMSDCEAHGVSTSRSSDEKCDNRLCFAGTEPPTCSSRATSATGSTRRATRSRTG